MDTEKFRTFMKLLVEENPHAIVSFLLKGATYKGNLDRELALTTYDSELSPELREPVLRADELYEVLWDGEDIILHLEFQRFGEQDASRKIWESNTMTTIVTSKLTYSVVIYGQPEPDIPGSVYQIRLPDGRVTHTFNFKQVKLWEIEPQAFEQPQFAGLLPLLPLTKNGREP